MNVVDRGTLIEVLPMLSCPLDGDVSFNRLNTNRCGTRLRVYSARKTAFVSMKRYCLDNKRKRKDVIKNWVFRVLGSM